MRIGLRNLRRGAAAIGRGADRIGDAGIEATRWIARNPGPSIVIFTTSLFVIVRVSLEAFYGSLGVQPEDVGFNSVQGTLLVSGLFLGMVLILTVLLALAVVVSSSLALGAYAAARGLLLGKGPPGQVRRAMRRGLRLGPVLIPLLGIPFAAYVLYYGAVEDLHSISSGKAIDNPLSPWRADRILVRWTTPERPYKRLNCDRLLYLGENGTRTVIFNASQGAVIEIASKDIDLIFYPRELENPPPPC